MLIVEQAASEPMRPPKAPSNGLVKSGPQPDLLHSSAVNRNNNVVTREVSRLEFLCEARTKELNFVKMQLKHCALGFDSLSVLVQYLTHELGAFSVPDLKAELLQMQKKLQLANEQLDEANATQTCLRDELSKCHEDHKLAMEHLNNEMLNNLKLTEGRLSGLHQQDIEKLTLSHHHENEQLRHQYESQVISLTESHKESENSLRGNLANELENLKMEHANAIEVLRQSYEEKFTCAKDEHDLSEKNYVKIIGDLSSECEELNKKNSSIHEILMNDGDPKLQAANIYCDKLEKEVSSLKSVLEMQQSDLKEFWSQKALMAKVTEDLSTAKAKIKKLQAKNEDLQAMVALKVENERELKKENQRLQDGYERKEKLVKRVSMENEGLQWRLRQSREFPPSFNVTDGSMAEGTSVRNSQSSYFWDNEGLLSPSTDPANTLSRSNYSSVKLSGSRSNSPITGPHNSLRSVRSSPFAGVNGINHQLGRPLSVPNYQSTPRSSLHVRGGAPTTPTLSLSDDESNTDWTDASQLSSVVMRNKFRPRIKVQQPTPAPRSAPPSMSSSLIASELEADVLNGASPVADEAKCPSSQADDTWLVTNGSCTNANNAADPINGGDCPNGGSSDEFEQHFYGQAHQPVGANFNEIWKNLHLRPYTPDSPSPDRFALESPDNDDEDEDDEDGSCDHLVEETCYKLTDNQASRLVRGGGSGGSSASGGSDAAGDDLKSLPELFSVNDEENCNIERDNLTGCGDADEDYSNSNSDPRGPQQQCPDAAAIINGFAEKHGGTAATLSDLQELTEENSRTSTSADDLLDHTADSSVDVPLETTTVVLDDSECNSPGNSPGSSPKKTTTTLVIVYRKSRHSPDSSRGSSPAPQLLETPVTSDGSDSMTSSTDSSPRTSPPLKHPPDECDPSDSNQSMPTNKALQMLENSLFAGMHSPRVSAGEAMMVLEERSSTASSSSSSREQPASLLVDPAHALLKRALQDHLQLCCDNGHGSSCGSSCCGASCSDFRGSVESCNTRGEPDSPPAGLSKPDTPESSQAVLPTDSTNIDLSWSDEDLPSETEV